jgi:hypothetical protein
VTTSIVSNEEVSMDGDSVHSRIAARLRAAAAEIARRSAD